GAMADLVGRGVAGGEPAGVRVGDGHGMGVHHVVDPGLEGGQIGGRRTGAGIGQGHGLLLQWATVPLPMPHPDGNGQQSPFLMNRMSRDTVTSLYHLVMLPSTVDGLDARLIRALSATPRIGILELARQLRVARGTVQARLDKLQRRAVVTGFGPDVDVRALGYDVLAFTTLEIAQGRLADVVDHLRDVPEVLEAQATTGP